VQQGKKIELDEIERWRVSGRADAARRRAETEKTALVLANEANEASESALSPKALKAPFKALQSSLRAF
jgi:regulator of protease activity HflC (stomatin/prohibitin superfamily)